MVYFTIQDNGKSKLKPVSNFVACMCKVGEGIDWKIKW